MSSYDKTFKILFLSDPEVDKSGMFPGYSTYFSQHDDQKTIGVEFMVKTLVIDKKRYKLQLWDIGREERFRFLLPTYCLGANAALLLYDITKPQTLNNIGEWANIVRQKGGDIPIMLVGIIPNENSKRQISAEEGKEIAKLKNLNSFIEIDARTGENVGKAYETIARLIIANENYFPTKKRDEDLSRNKDNLKEKKTWDSKSYFKLKSKGLSPKRTSKPPIHPSPLPKQLGDPRIAPQGKESYRDQIINLLSKIERFWEFTNSRIIAVTLVQGSDTILYSTDNWDIRTDVGRVLSSWNSMNARFIMLSGVKYSVLECTSERLIATSVRGEGHIIGLRNEDLRLLLNLKPNGDDDSMVYPYIFTPPNPPDDFEMSPQVQLRAPPRSRKAYPDQIINSNFINWDEISGIQWIYCQKCRRKLSKENFFTHSCKKKSSGPRIWRQRKLTSPVGDKIDPRLKSEVQSFLEWIKDSEGLSGYINYYLQQNNLSIISELSKIYSELRKIFGV